MTPRLWMAVSLALVAVAIASLALPLSLPDDSELARAILIELRAPRTILALVYGGMLGASGAAIQALFANPLASPDLTGATSGAALGAVVTAYLGGVTAPLALSAGSIAGALAALSLLLALAGPRAETASLLLAGLAISAVAGALTILALALAPSPFAFYDAFDWLMGSMVDRSLAQAGFAALPALAAIAFLARRRDALDSLALGEEVSQSIGHDLRQIRLEVVGLTALGVGACVAICGAIGFIGLVAPILARRASEGHPGRAILPASAIGALLLVVADLAVRTAPAGRVLPIGVVTALVGAPFFVWLVIRHGWLAER